MHACVCLSVCKVYGERYRCAGVAAVFSIYITPSTDAATTPSSVIVDALQRFDYGNGCVGMHMYAQDEEEKERSEREEDNQRQRDISLLSFLLPSSLSTSVASVFYVCFSLPRCISLCVSIHISLSLCLFPSICMWMNVFLLSVFLSLLQVLRLCEQRKTLQDYLSTKLEFVSPNLKAVVGEVLAARLISHAGALVNLAKYPASTIQILGAEKVNKATLYMKSKNAALSLSFLSSLFSLSLLIGIDESVDDVLVLFSLSAV